MRNCRDWCTERGKTVAFCGTERVNFNNNVIKILGICYSYDKKL